MVNVIKKKCSVTEKIIMGVGQDEFDANWKAHIESLNIKPSKTEKKEEKVEKDIDDMKRSELVDLAEDAGIEVKSGMSKGAILKELKNLEE